MALYLECVNHIRFVFVAIFNALDDLQLININSALFTDAIPMQ